MSDANWSCHRKRRYMTEFTAMAVARHCTQARGVPLTWYACPMCLAWHLTKRLP